MNTNSHPGAASPPFIPLYNPQIDGNAWDYVKECLDTAWVSSAGSFVDRFETMLAERAGVKYAVAVSSGTAALHTAFLLAGVQPDDEVVVSTLTFIASANSIRYCGAHPVFIDSEPRHWQIDPQLVEEFLTRQCRWKDGRLVNAKTGRRIAALVPVHVLGHPVDMPPLLELANRFRIPVVEDAAEGVGVKHRGKPVGGFGEIGCYSFNGNKLITTGGGGALLTNDAKKASRARYLTTQAKDDPVNYIHGEIGFNYRLTNLQAALGCAQLESVDRFVERKRTAAAEYRTALSTVPGVELQDISPEASCTFWLNTVSFNPVRFGMDSRELMQRLGKEGIQSRPLWQPMHQSPAHRGAQSVLTGVADRLFASCLSLPSSVGLTSADVQRVVQTIARIQRSNLDAAGQRLSA